MALRLIPVENDEDTRTPRLIPLDETPRLKLVPLDEEPGPALSPHPAPPGVPAAGPGGPLVAPVPPASESLPEPRGFGQFLAPLARAAAPYIPSSIPEAIETAMSPLSKPFSAVAKKAAGAIPAAVSAVETGAAEFNAALARTPNFLYNAAALPINQALKAAGIPEIQDPQYFEKEAKWWEAKAAETDIGQRRWGDKGENLMTLAQKGDAPEAAKYLAWQVLKNAPQQALYVGSALAGVPAFGLGIAGTTSGAQSLAEGRRLGASPNKAVLNAVLTGTIEAGFERLGTFGLAEKWGNVLAKSFGKGGATNVLKGTLKALFQEPLGEANEEFWTSLAQDMSKVVTGVDPQAMRGSMARALEAGAIGGASGATMTVPGAAGAALRKSVVSRETLNPQAMEYLGSKFPSLVKATEGQEIPISRENLQEVVKQAAAAGEEALLRTGNPQEADIAALKTFVDQVRPAVERSRTQERAAQRPGIPESQGEETGRRRPNPGLADVAESLGLKPYDLPLEQYEEAFGEGRATEEVQAEHQRAVREAFDRGEAVPQDVLDRYDVPRQAARERARAAAQEVLAANEITDRVAVDLVDAIAVDNEAFKAGRGTDYSEEGFEVLGATTTQEAEGRVQAVIQLALGSTEATGRHEAFHAVTNMLLDKADQDIILGKYGDMEKAADAFGEFRAGAQTEGAIQRIFEKIKLFLERFANYVKARKWTTAADIFRDIDAGKLGREVASGVPEYSARAKKTSDQTQTPEFRKWFGESKVVDESGKPLVVYHGTTAGKITAFMPQVTGRRTGNRYPGGALFFTDDAPSASAYAVRPTAGGEFEQPHPLDEPNVVPVYLSMQNPLVVDAKDESWTNVTEAAIKRARENGHDGVILKNILDHASVLTALERGPINVYVAFRPEQIKSATGNRGTFDPKNPDIRYSAKEKQPIFYSQLQKTIQEKVPNSAPVEQVRNILKGGAVKQEEIDWSGVEDFLMGKQKVTKAELMEFLRQNEVQVKEVVKGQKQGKIEWDGNELMFNGETVAAIKPQGSGWIAYDTYVGPVEEGTLTTTVSEDVAREAAENFAREGNKTFAGSEDNTKFGAHTLPGGENYRELLLTLPEKTPRSEPPPEPIKSLPEGYDPIHDANAPADRQWGITPPGQVHARFWEGAHPTREAAVKAAIDRINRDAELSWEDKNRKARESGLFKGGHFDEPNILAHVRFNDRVDAEGKKVLFVEEIQSDWHQGGREKGYDDRPEILAKLKAQGIEKEAGSAYGFKNADGKYVAHPNSNMYPEYAVEGTPEQADLISRYFAADRSVPNAPFKKTWHELAMKRMIRWASENGYDKVAWTTGAQQADRYDLSKQLDRIEWERDPKTDKFHVYAFEKGGGMDAPIITKEGLSRSELAEAIGKDAANNIIESIPDAPISKSGREIGVLEGEGLQVGGEGMKGFYDKILPAFVNKYTKKWGGRVGESNINSEKGWVVKRSNGERIQYATERDARARANGLAGAEVIKPTAGDKVHSLDITPAMKESVLQEGQPLYSAEERTPESFLKEAQRIERLQKRDMAQVSLPSRREAPKEYTEAAALRRSLQRQAYAAAQADARARQEAAYEARWTEAERKAMLKWQEAELKAEGKTKAEEIKGRARQAAEGLAGIKKQVAEIVNKGLPLSERGRFTLAVANAKTARDITKVAQRVDQALETFQRRTLIKAVKREFQRVTASKAIAIDYVWKIKGLMDTVLTAKPSTVTRARLVETQKFIDRQRAAGQDVTVPQYVLDRVRILAAKPLADMPASQIEDFLIQMRTLADLGKTKLRAVKAIEATQKANDLKDLHAGSAALNAQELTPRLPGETLPMPAAVGNLLKRAMNINQKAQYALMPMDVVFDVLDGNQNFAGPNYRIFKARVDAAFGDYLDETAKFKQDTLAKGKGLNDKNMERIGVYALAAQEGGREKLKNNGMTDEQIDKIKLTPAETAFYTHMRKQLDALRPRVAEAMRKVYNADLGEVKNYFPFMTDWELMSQQDVRDRMLESMIGLRKNVEQGFTKTRAGAGKQKVNINAMDVYLKHIDDVAYLLHMGQTSKYLGELAATKAFGDAAGNVGQRIVREWVDTVAKKGGGLGDKQMRWMDALRKNVSVAGLGLRASSALVQTTALLQGGALIGPYAFKGAANLASKNWRAFIRDNFPEVRERGGDDPAFLEFSGEGVRDKTGRMVMWPLRKLDLLAAAGVASGAYEKYMADRGLPVDFARPDKEAVAYAQRILRRTQSSGFFKDVPQALSRGSLTGNLSMDKALLQFQSFVLNNYSLLTHEGFRAGIARGRVGQSANIALWTALAVMAATGIVRGAKDFLKGDDDKKEEDTYWKALAKNFLGNIPFVSQLVGTAVYGSSLPVMDVGKRGAQGVYRALKGKKPETRVRGAMDALSNLSTVAGLPIPSQAVDLGKRLVPESRKSRPKRRKRRS